MRLYDTMEHVIQPKTTQTYALLRRALPRDLADITHTYLYKEEGYHNTWPIMHGYYELCMYTQNYSRGCYTACLYGYVKIADDMLCREVGDMAGVDTLYNMNDCLTAACSSRHQDCIQFTIDHGARRCQWCGKNSSEHHAGSKT